MPENSQNSAILSPNSMTGTDDPQEAIRNLSSRLVEFRGWLTKDAGAKIHPGICIVNGEATDGSKNAPLLQVGSHPGGVIPPVDSKGRLGAIDKGGDQALFDCTTGCQVRTTREIKADEVIMEIPKSSMITADLVAASDAGRAVRACCGDLERNFWDCFENTTRCEEQFSSKVDNINSGPNLLLKILNERKLAESAFQNHSVETHTPFPPGKVSTRAPFLAFLIQQRFSAESGVVKVDTAISENQFMGIKGQTIEIPENSPSSFAAYAKTLPSIVGVPLCWKREELALMCGIPGVNLLKEVAKATMFLVSEFTALVEAGISEKFPETFPPGLLTWDRWIWAAAIHSSRLLPVSCYAEKEPEEIQSPYEIWRELGVMIPCLDMLNHEGGSNHVKWEAEFSGEPGEGSAVRGLARGVLLEKIKKGNEIYLNYGQLNNLRMILQYGFAHIDNPDAEVVVGWSISDCVGRKEKDPVNRFVIKESSESELITKWWSDSRFDIIKREVFASRDQDFENMKNGMKVRAKVYNYEKFDELLLALFVFATMPGHDIDRLIKNGASDDDVVLSSMHRTQLREYMAYFFSQKLEKLLANLDKELKNRFGGLNLWTWVKEGGLDYSGEGNGEADPKLGWNEFFERHAYSTAIEVEGNYYAMSPVSCALSLYDGQLRALSKAVEACESDEAFSERVGDQLKSMGFSLDSQAPSSSDNGDQRSSKKTSRKRKRKNRRGSNMKAIDSNTRGASKLHIGNLAFDTTPSILIDYFATKYGKDSVFECQIPQEKDSVRSRGYGFITVREDIVDQVTGSGVKHEVGGRILKVSKSTSTATIAPVRSLSSGQGQSSLGNERCQKCGYRPKYCNCEVPEFKSSSRDRRDEGTRDDRRRYSREYSPDYDYYRRRRDDDRDRRYRYDDYYGRDDYYDDRRGEGRRRSREDSRSPSRGRYYDDDYRASDRRYSRSHSRERSSKRRRSRSPTGSVEDKI